jgi:methyltransferase
MGLSTVLLYIIFIVLTGIERLVEVSVSNRNAAWSFEQGGIERGKGHYPFMVVLHTGFLIGAVAEVVLMERTFDVMFGSIWLFVAVACQALRWWCINSLGKRWNTRVILVPNLPRVRTGPYKYLSHPNYVIVALEGLALPLIHNAYWTAAVFMILNAGLMWVRIRCEEAALQELCSEPLTTES